MNSHLKVAFTFIHLFNKWCRSLKFDKWVKFKKNMFDQDIKVLNHVVNHEKEGQNVGNRPSFMWESRFTGIGTLELMTIFFQDTVKKAFFMEFGNSVSFQEFGMTNPPTTPHLGKFRIDKNVTT